jgi:uncharacterized protein
MLSATGLQVTALATPDRSAHVRAVHWLGKVSRFATCPITQGALVRFQPRWASQPSIINAKHSIRRIASVPHQQFWPDDIDFQAIPEKGATGHRQVTNAYLVALAQAHGGQLATMDEAIAAFHSSALLI